MPRACSGECRNTCPRRRSAGEHIVDQHYITPRNKLQAMPVNNDRPRQRPLTRLAPETAEAGCPFAADQPVDQRFALAEPGQIACQQRRLVETALP